MSNKFYKKIRKEARAEVNRKFESGLSVLSTMIRPRPKFVPRFIWILFYTPVFKRNTIKYIYKHLN